MTHDLKTSLDDLAEAAYADAPVSSIDIGRARADGRRRVLASRAAPIGGGVAVVAACALVVNGLGGTSPAKPGAPATSAAAGPEFTGTDPLTAIAKFGWLPDGFQTASYMSGTDYGNSVTAATKPVGTVGDQPAGVWHLSLNASPTEPKLVAVEKKEPTSVKGSPKAYFILTPGDNPAIPDEIGLAWETASGSWFSLGGDFQTHGAELKAQLTKVADSVSADGAAVPLPIHIEGLPKGVTLGEASLDDPAEVGATGFSVGLAYQSGTEPGTGRQVSISVSSGSQPKPAGSHTDALAKAGIKVSPTPARDTCKDSKGLHICVQEDPGPAGPDPLASVGGAQGLLDRITSLGTDRANWTTHVVN